jgi:hypothetical protein
MTNRQYKRSRQGKGLGLRAPDDDPDVIASPFRQPRSSADPGSQG